MFQPGSWVVRVDARLRPIIEEIAMSEERSRAFVVRRLLEQAIASNAIKEGRTKPSEI
jgi:predicted transcriptional regulator